jgi:hypothetical protein
MALWRVIAARLSALRAETEWRKMRHIDAAVMESTMSSPSPNFSSVKLPASLVDQARRAAEAQRRSVAGQIEYWATLGQITEETGLTVLEAREAIARYDAQAQDHAALDAIEARFAEAAASGGLAQAVRKTVQTDRQRAAVAAPARARRAA